MTRPPAAAQSSSARRRGGASTTPVGNWCAGVSSTAGAPLRASAATSRPCSSTGTGTGRRPQCASSSRAPLDPGSSTAMRLMPAARSCWASSAMAWATPATMRIASGCARMPRVRASQPVSSARSRSLPRGSPYPRSAALALASTARSARSQAARGNADRSGTPGDRSSSACAPHRRGRSSSAGAPVGVRRSLRPAHRCAQPGLLRSPARAGPGRRPAGPGPPAPCPPPPPCPARAAVRRRAGWRGARQHRGAGPLPRADQALVGQPLVGLDDHAAGHAEITGQQPGGRQHRAGRQPPVPDAGPQRADQPAGQPAGPARPPGPAGGSPRPAAGLRRPAAGSVAGIGPL